MQEQNLMKIKSISASKQASEKSEIYMLRVRSDDKKVARAFEINKKLFCCELEFSHFIDSAHILVCNYLAK